MLHAERTHQYPDLVPAPHNFHMLEGCCAFWQILEHAAGPLQQQPLSKDENFVLHFFKNTFGNAVVICIDFCAKDVIINVLSGVFRSSDDNALAQYLMSRM